MKNFAIIVAICLVLLSGCNKSISTEVVDDNEMIKEFVLYNSITLKEDDEKSFLDYLENSYDISIEDRTLDSIDDIKTIDGILKLDLMTLRTIWNERETYLTPLNEIISQSNYLDSFPASVKNAVSDSDGNVWGLLVSHRFKTFARVYDAKIMEEMNMDVPESLDDFYTLVRKVKDSYDSPAIKVSSENCSEQLYDIFAAYGIPLFSFKYTIGWDEKTGEYVDIADSPEMADCLTTLKGLVDEGIIELSDYPVNYSDSIFTYAMDTARGISKSDFTLMFDQSKNLLESQDMFVFTIPANSLNPGEKLEDFISLFYEDDKLNKIGRIGIEDTYFEYVNKNAVKYKANKVSYPMLSDYWIDNQYIVLDNEYDIDEDDHWYEKGINEIKTAFYEGNYEVISFIHSILDFERIGMINPQYKELHNTFSVKLFEFLKNDMTVSKFLIEYEKEMKEKGIEEYFKQKEMN